MKAATSPKLYKLLDPGSKAHFVEFSYKAFLPRDGQPGAWTPPVKGQLQRCRNGYHLTSTPEGWLWYFDGPPAVYEAEGKGERVYKSPHKPHKRVFKSIRLLRRVTAAEWKAATK